MSLPSSGADVALLSYLTEEPRDQVSSLRPGRSSWLILLMSALLLLSGASGFVLPSQPGLCRPGRPGTAAAAAASAPTILTVLHPQAAPTRTAAAPVQMGLFGLGYPEIAVIALVGVALLGPEKLIPMAKDLGSALPPLNTLRALGPRVMS